jgi:hypothetical protein
MKHCTRRTAVAGLSAALAAGLTAPARARAATRPTEGLRPADELWPAEEPRTAGRAGGRDPLRRAHAHNDYEHPRPLLDALAHGFGSVEADIWLVDGQLLVAHEESDLDPTRTLETLYLDPLRARIRANGGTVYRGHRLSLQLLIDIKTAGGPAYLELARRLRPYRRMLSVGAHGKVRRGAVTAVISGDRGARVPMEAERVRYAFYDGRPEDLGSGVPASFIPLISGNWTQSFTWSGTGPMPEPERARLRRIVSAAHADRQRVRFWATPDLPGPEREAVWTELLAADADYLNSDDLPGLECFLRAAR